tara:strand:+ start:1990 stop:11676 length:9687 start_codon:yes stop_codon:yes gene_type:complete
LFADPAATYQDARRRFEEEQQRRRLEDLRFEEERKRLQQEQDRLLGRQWIRRDENWGGPDLEAERAIRGELGMSDDPGRPALFDRARDSQSVSNRYPPDPLVEQAIQGTLGQGYPDEGYVSRQFQPPKPQPNLISRYIEKEDISPKAAADMSDAFRQGDLEARARQNELLSFANGETIPQYVMRRAKRKVEEAQAEPWHQRALSRIEAGGAFGDQPLQWSQGGPETPVNAMIRNSENPLATALQTKHLWMPAESLSDRELEDLQPWGVSEDGTFEIQFTPTYDPSSVEGPYGTRSHLEEREKRLSDDPFFREMQRRAGALEVNVPTRLTPEQGPKALRAAPYYEAVRAFEASETPVAPPPELRQVGERRVYETARVRMERAYAEAQARGEEGIDPSMLSNDPMASSVKLPVGRSVDGVFYPKMEPVFAPPPMPQMSQAQMMRLPFGDPRAMTGKEGDVLGTISDSWRKIHAGAVQTFGNMALIPDIAAKLTGLGEGPEWLNRFARESEFQTRLINEGLSDLQKKADFELAATRDLKEAIQGLSPRAAWGMAMESVPFMLASGVTGIGSRAVLGMVGRAVGRGQITRTMADKLPALVRKHGKAGADALYWGSGEGIVSMAAAYAGMPDRDAHSARMAAITGFGVSLVGGISNRMATRFGIDDVDQLFMPKTPTGRVLDDAVEEGLDLLGRPVRGPGSRGYLVEAVGKQAVIPSLLEGAEELVQSGFEEAINNLEAGRPWSDGTARAAVLGAITGVLASGSRLGPQKFIGAVSDQLEAEKQTPEWLNKFKSEAKKTLADIVYSARRIFDFETRDRLNALGRTLTPGTLEGKAKFKAIELVRANQTVMTLSDAAFDQVLGNVANGRKLYEGVDLESNRLAPQLERGRERLKRLAAVMVDARQGAVEALPTDELASLPIYKSGEKKGRINLDRMTPRQVRQADERQQLENDRGMWMTLLENLNKDITFGTKNMSGLQQTDVAVSLPDGVRSSAELEEGHAVVELTSDNDVRAVWDANPGNWITQGDGTVVIRERPDGNKTSTFTLPDYDAAGKPTGTRTTYVPTLSFFESLAERFGLKSTREDVLAHELNVRTAEEVLDKTPDTAEEIVTAALSGDTSKVTPNTVEYAKAVTAQMGPVDAMTTEAKRELSREIVSHELSRRAMGETPQRLVEEQQTEVEEALTVGLSTSGVSVRTSSEVSDELRQKKTAKRELEEAGKNKTEKEKEVLQQLSEEIKSIEETHGVDVVTGSAQVDVADPEKSSFAPSTTSGDVAIEQDLTPPLGDKQVGDVVEYEAGGEYRITAIWNDGSDRFVQLVPVGGDGPVVELSGPIDLRTLTILDLHAGQQPDTLVVNPFETGDKDVKISRSELEAIVAEKTREADSLYAQIEAVPETFDADGNLLSEQRELQAEWHRVSKGLEAARMILNIRPDAIYEGGVDSSNSIFGRQVGDTIRWGGPRGKILNREQTTEAGTGRITLTLTIQPEGAPEGQTARVIVKDPAAGPEWEQKVRSHRLLNAVKVPELVRIISRILTAAHEAVSLRSLPQYPRVVELKDRNGQVRWYRGMNQNVALPKDFYVMFREHHGDRANTLLDVKPGDESEDLNGTIDLPFESSDAESSGLAYLVMDAREVAEKGQWRNGTKATDAEITAAKGFVAKYDDFVQSVQNIEMEIHPAALREYQETLDAEGNVVDRKRIDANDLEVAALLAHELGHLIGWLRGRATGSDPLINKMRAVFDAGMLTANKYMDRKWHKKDLKTEEAKLRKQAEDLSFQWRPFNLEKARERVKELRSENRTGPANKLAEHINYRLSTEELYADFFSALMVNPVLANEIAPDLVARFVEHLERLPAANTALIQVWDILEHGETLDERHREYLKSFQVVDKAAKDALDEKMANQVMTPAKTFSGIMRAYVSRHWPVEKKFRDWLVKTGKVSRDVSDQFNIPNLLAKSTVIQGAVTAYVNNYFGKMQGVLEKYNIRFDDAGVIAGLMRIASGDREGVANPLGINTTSEAQELLDHILDGYSEQQREALMGVGGVMEQFSDAVWHVTDRAYAEGLIPKKTYNEMRKRKDEGRYYATFQSLYHITEELSPDFHPSEGMFEPTRNPITATMLKMATILRAVEWNNIKRGVVSQMREMYPEEVVPPGSKEKQTGEKDLIRYTTTKQHGGATLHLVYFRQEGKSRAFYVAKEIAESLNRQPPSFNDPMLRWLKSHNEKMFRPLFTVANPGFQLVNLWRDFWRFYRNLSHEGRSVGFFQSFKRYYQAHGIARARVFGEKRESGFTVFGSRLLKHAMEPSERETAEQAAQDVILLGEKMTWGITINDFFEGKHDQDPSVVSDASMLGLDSDSLTRRLFGSRQLGRVYDFIKHTGDYIETLPKAAAAIHIAETKYGGDMTQLDDHDIRFIRERVGSPDFLAGGTQKGWSNELFLFSNAMIQGWRSDIETARDPETQSGFMWKMAGTSILPKTLMHLAATGVLAPVLTGVKQAMLAISPDEWDEEAEWLGSKLEQVGERYVRLYSNMSSYDMMNYMILPLWEDDVSGQVALLRIPMGDTQRVIGGLYYSLLLALPYGRDRQMMEQQVELARSKGMGAWFDVGASALAGAFVAGAASHYGRKKLGLTGGWTRTMAWSGFGAVLGGAMAQRASLGGAAKDLMGQVTGYAGEQLPGLSPTLGILPGIAQYIMSSAGNGRPNYGPYDRYRGLRPVISQQEHSLGMFGAPSRKRGATFGDHMLSKWQTATGKKFLGWMTNEAGGGIVHRVQFYPQATEKGQLQNLMETPFISNILGRFLRWSDYGATQASESAVEHTEIEREKDAEYQDTMVNTMGRGIYIQDSYDVRRALGADGYPDPTQRYADMNGTYLTNAASFNYLGTITNPANGEPMEFKSMMSMTPEDRERQLAYTESGQQYFREYPILSPEEGHPSSVSAFQGLKNQRGETVIPEGSRIPGESPSFAIPSMDPTPDEPGLEGRDSVARRIFEAFQGSLITGVPLHGVQGVHPETFAAYVRVLQATEGRQDTEDGYMASPNIPGTQSGRDFLASVMFGTLADGTPTQYADQNYAEAREMVRALSLRRDEFAETGRKYFVMKTIVDDDDWAHSIADPGLSGNRHVRFRGEFSRYPDTPEGNLAMRNRVANLTIYLTGGREQFEEWIDAEVQADIGSGVKLWNDGRLEGELSLEDFKRRWDQGQAEWDATPIDVLRKRSDISIADDVTDSDRFGVDPNRGSNITFSGFGNWR